MTLHFPTLFSGSFKIYKSLIEGYLQKWLKVNSLAGIGITLCYEENVPKIEEQNFKVRRVIKGKEISVTQFKRYDSFERE